jgi:hypothetical protein
MNKYERSCSPKKSLEQSVKEMKKMRTEEQEKVTWDQYIKGEK